MDRHSADDRAAQGDRDISSDVRDSRGRAESVSPARVPAPLPRPLNIIFSDGRGGADNRDPSKVSEGALGTFSTLHSKQRQVLSAEDQAEKGLWETLERVMASRRARVQQSLEEFGIVADVSPNSDLQEEQMWRVVQGELNGQGMADLV